MAQSPVAGAGPGRQGRKQPEMRCTEPALLGMTPDLSLHEGPIRPDPS